MLYSDYLLARKPWSYCKLNQIEDDFLYYDYSTNDNHMKSIDSNLTNTINYIEYTNDDIQYDRSFPQFDLYFNVPCFKTNVIFYRLREKIQNDLFIKDMNIDFLLYNFNPDFIQYQALLKANLFEEQCFDIDVNIDEYEKLNMYDNIYLHPFQLLTQTHSFFYKPLFVFGNINAFIVYDFFEDYDSTLLYQKVSLDIYVDDICYHSILLRTNNYADNEITEEDFINETRHRFIIGLTQEEDKQYLKISIDGADIIEIELNEQITINHDSYKYIGFYGNICLSNVAIYFNKDFPTQEFIDASQFLLDNPFTNQFIEKKQHILSENDYNNSIISNRSLSSYIDFFDKILLDGSKHNFIKSIEHNDEDIVLVLPKDSIDPSLSVSLSENITFEQNSFPLLGIWKIHIITNTSIVVKPSLSAKMMFSLSKGNQTYQCNNVSFDEDIIPELTIKIENHNFIVGEYVVFYSYYKEELEHNWYVTSVDGDKIRIRIDYSFLSAYVNDNALIVKKIPIGGINCWNKNYNNNEIEYIPYNSNKIMLLKNHTQFYSMVFLDNEAVYLFKNKDSLFRVIGDPYRFYLFFANRSKSVSQSQLFLFGKVGNFLDFEEEQKTLLLGYEINNDKDPGYNYAFQYGYWQILPSGHLFCQNYANSRETDIISNKINVIDDGGYHFYPNNL